jgi:zinc protease
LRNLIVLFLLCSVVTGAFASRQNPSSGSAHSPVLKKMLENGVTVLLMEDHSAPVVSCQVYSRMGTRDEDAGANGSAFAVAQAVVHSSNYSFVEGLGLAIQDDETTRAIVNRDFIGLLLKGSMDKLDSLVERASVFDNFDNVGIAIRARSTPAIDQNDSLIQSYNLRARIYDQLFEAAYGSGGDGHALIDGEESAKLTEPAFRKFVRISGSPDRLVVVIAGDFEPTYTMLLVNRLFGHRHADAVAFEKIKVDTAIRPATARLDLKSGVKDDILAIGYRVPGSDNPDFAALTVLAALLGGGQSSILSQRFMVPDSPDYRAAELSCRMGSYGAMSSKNLFSIYVREPLSPYYSIWQSEHFINDEIAKVQQQSIGSEQLNIAKRFLLAEFRRQTESIDGRAFAESIGFLRTDRLTWVDDCVAAIQSVTAADIQRVASQYLVDANRSAVTIVTVPAARAEK